MCVEPQIERDVGYLRGFRLSAWPSVPNIYNNKDICYNFDVIGDMAQSGERRVRIAKVGGSNPPISTKIESNDITLISLEFLPLFLLLQILASVSGN